ncbi:hypothetical protein NW762_010871 [Fusarium torreyae]|uniref:Uncharacterized protein n=1 Tax=Fusarium torreyae TaxID=1237075 RepID=A0A9W8VA39_9HYPO|nr:hypothetical protein NW762_010871 [Fusarium torreyae]
MVILGSTALQRGVETQGSHAGLSINTEPDFEASSEQERIAATEAENDNAEIAALLEKRAKRGGKLLKKDRIRLTNLEQKIASITKAENGPAIEASKCSIRELTIGAQKLFSQITEEQEIIAMLEQQDKDGKLPQKEQDRLDSLREKKAQRSLIQEAPKTDTTITSSGQGHLVQTSSSISSPESSAKVISARHSQRGTTYVWDDLGQTSQKAKIASHSPSVNDNTSFSSDNIGWATPSSSGHSWEALD